MTQRHVRRTVIATAALYLSLACATAFCAEFVRVPGTQIELTPPQGFGPSDQFPGFSRADRRAGIEVAEIPGPYSQILASLESKQDFLQRGMTLLQVEHLRIGGVDGVLSRVTEEIGGVSTTRLMAAFGDESHTATIVGVFQNDEPPSTSNSIRNSILTARWSAATPTSQFEGLAFTITESPTLRIRRKISTHVVLGPPENPSSHGPADVLLIIAMVPGALEEQQLEPFAKQQLQVAKTLTDVRNFEGTALRIDGLPAFELTADARLSDNGSPLKAYALMIADTAGHRYFFAMGHVGAAAATKTLADFRAVAHSLKVVR